VCATEFWKWLTPQPKQLASDQIRAEWFEYLRDSPEAEVESAQVTELLLREVKYSIDVKIATIRATEGKAAAQVAVLGGGLGIVSILGVAQSSFNITGNLWLFIAACVFLLIAAAIDVLCIAAGYTEKLPHLDIFNSLGIVRSSAMKGRVGMSLTEGYLDYDSELLAFSLNKARLLKTATAALLAGVFVLAGNAGWADLYRKAEPAAQATCQLNSNKINCEVIRR
jgi:hypothetical protein